MLAKVFESKITLVVIIAILAIAFIWATDSGSSDSDSDFDADNSYYQRLKEKIDNYGDSKKWETTNYNSINNSILEDNNIDDDEKQDLTKNLISVHLLLLNDSIKSFCKYNDNLRSSSINDLENDVDKFTELPTGISTKNSLELIELYRKLCSTVYAIYYTKRSKVTKKIEHKGYTAEKKYNEQKTGYYDKVLREYLALAYFSENEFLSIRIENALNRLVSHKNKDMEYKNGKSEKESCDCKDFFESYTYYINKCDSIQKIRDNETDENL